MEGATSAWLVLGAVALLLYFFVAYPHLAGDPWGAWGQRESWIRLTVVTQLAVLAATLLPTWDAFLRHDAEWAHERGRTATAVVLTLVCLALAGAQYAFHARRGRPLVWLPFLVSVTVYNAWGASQYAVQGAQRAVVYQFVTLTMAWASLQLHEPDLGTPDAPKPAAVPSAAQAALYLATFDLPVCLYAFQWFTLVVRLGAGHDDPEARWNDMPPWAPAPALCLLGLKCAWVGLRTGNVWPVRWRVPPPAKPVPSGEDKPLVPTVAGRSSLRFA